MIVMKKKLVVELPIEGNDIGLSDLERFISESSADDVQGVGIEVSRYVDDEQATMDGVHRAYGVGGEKFKATIVEYEEEDEY